MTDKNRSAAADVLGIGGGSFCIWNATAGCIRRIGGLLVNKTNAALFLPFSAVIMIEKKFSVKPMPNMLFLKWYLR